MITCLKVLPSKYGISSPLRPAEIIVAYQNPYYYKLNITSVAYAQVYMGNTNSTRQRTVGAIALSPANKWGGYYLMYLTTRK